MEGGHKREKESEYVGKEYKKENNRKGNKNG